MFKFSTVLAFVLACSSALTLSGCGFALRGTDNTSAIAQNYRHVAIELDGKSDSLGLERPLTDRLAMLGVSVSAASNNAKIAIKDVHFRRYELLGTLTEARLVLIATVDFYTVKDGKTHVQSRSLEVTQNYQYNEASVLGQDRQGNQAKLWLYDNLAEQIAEQYRAIAQPAP